MIGAVWMGLMSGAVAETPVDVVLIEAVRKAQPLYVEGPTETCVAMLDIEDGAALRVFVTGCSWPRAVEVFRALRGWSWSERGVAEPLSSGRTRVSVRFEATPGWVVPYTDEAPDRMTVFGTDGRTLTWSRTDDWERTLGVVVEPPQLSGRCSFSVEDGVSMPRGSCPDPLVAFSRAWFALAAPDAVETWTVLTELPGD